MRRTREVKVGDTSGTVKELNVAEIRAWLKDMESPSQGNLADDAVGAVLFEELGLSELARMVDGVSLDDLTPSEIRALIEAAKELNADFFAMRDRVVEAGRQVLEAAQQAVHDRSS
jgi:hypothetical protein